MEYIWNEGSEWLSWFLYRNKRLIISKCLWKVCGYVVRILCFRSLSLLQQSWMKLGFNAEDDWCWVTVYFRYWYVFVYWKVYEVVFPLRAKDTAKSIRDTWNDMMIASQVNVLRIWTQITYLVGQCVNTFLKVD